MKTRFAYIHFVPLPSGGKTSKWRCRNNRTGAELGEVGWYGAWRRYCFAVQPPLVFPPMSIILSAECLADIQEFLEGLMAERRVEAA